MKKITHSAWFKDEVSQKSIGIVITTDEKTDECQAYIAIVDVAGSRSSAIYVVQHGALFPLPSALHFMRNEKSQIVPPIELQQ